MQLFVFRFLVVMITSCNSGKSYLRINSFHKISDNLSYVLWYNTYDVMNKKCRAQGCKFMLLTKG